MQFETAPVFTCASMCVFSPSDCAHPGTLAAKLFSASVASQVFSSSKLPSSSACKQRPSTPTRNSGTKFSAKFTNPLTSLPRRRSGRCRIDTFNYDTTISASRIATVERALEDHRLSSSGCLGFDICDAMHPLYWKINLLVCPIDTSSR